MAILEFPSLNTADENGLLAIGGDLEPESLLLAYSKGIFPWPISLEYPLAWFSPDPRGILAYENLHLSKSLHKFLKKCPYEVKFNTNFEAVITHCSKVKRAHETSTWITDEIIEAYKEFHKAGYAYSVEVYHHHKLIGGVYGVNINNYACGESMFHLEPNASKVALVALMNRLHQKGIMWLDTQMLTPVVQHLGGTYVSRQEFISLLKKSIKK